MDASDRDTRSFVSVVIQFFPLKPWLHKRLSVQLLESRPASAPVQQRRATILLYPSWLMTIGIMSKALCHDITTLGFSHCSTELVTLILAAFANSIDVLFCRVKCWKHLWFSGSVDNKLQVTVVASFTPYMMCDFELKCIPFLYIVVLNEKGSLVSVPSRLTHGRLFINPGT